MTIYVTPGLCFTAGAIVGFFVSLALLAAFAVLLGKDEKNKEAEKENE